MLGALTLQGMQPGPLMFTDHGDMVYTLFVGMIFCYFMLLVLGLLSLKVIGNVVKIPGNILTPMILALCVVGTYALNNSLFDVGIMLIAGVVGYFMQKGGYPASPVVLALIMGPMAESNFRRALSLSGGSLDFLYTRPITLALLTLKRLYATDANNPQNNAFTASITDIAPRSWGAFFYFSRRRAASTTIFTAWLSVCFIVSAFGISCWVRLTITPATIPARRP